MRLVRHSVIGMLAFCTIHVVAPAQQAPAQRVLPAIPVTEFTLSNGLRVILHEDHSVPIVAVNVWYHVGSKNETPGRTGFAHLFEHMMFQGSKNYDDDYFRPLQSVGGTINGSTNTDRTNYFEVLPSNYLERALYLEADRMGGLLDALTEVKLANQRDVVKNEKRQNYDNRPYGLAGARIAELMYPSDHPYHWLTIGALEDLTAASMNDVKGFFRRFYTPNNASLAIAGDINPREARALVTKHFGTIPRGPAANRVVARQPVIAKEIRDSMQDQVALPRVYMVWHTVPEFSGDDAALDVLAAILAEGRSSRLNRSLVYDLQIAQDVSANHNSRELAGTFQISVTSKRGASLDSVEAVIKREIAKLVAEPPSREVVDRVYNGREAAFVYGLQTVQGKSDRLNGYATFRGVPAWFEQHLERYRAVTPADVQRVARQYLTDKRLVLTVLPGAREERTPTTVATTAGATPVPAAAASTATQVKRPEAAVPAGGPAPRFSLPQIQRRRLTNGLEVIVVEHHELPVVTMNLVVKSGSAADPAERAGLANAVANLLDDGTATKSAIDIAEQLAAIGAQLSTSASWDASTVSLTTLTRHTDAALGIFSDVLLHPAFADAEVARFRASRLTSLAQQRTDPTAISGVVYPALLYGRGHPYGRPALGDEASIQALTAADVRAFYEARYSPTNSSLVIVGDVAPDQIVAKLEQAFAGWKPGMAPAAPVTLPAPPAPRDKSVIYVVDRPGAAQSVINIGHVGVARSSPDYFPLLVLNHILGGQFMSRVNLNLRENKGYTYGARTAFEYRQGPGPFAASAGVQTAVTRESVAEFLKELRGIRGEIPVTAEELETAKRGLTLAFPRSFETPAQIAGRLTDVVLYGLAPDYFNSYVANIERVSLGDITRVANSAIDPARMAILVVGDRKVIEPGLRSLEGLGSTVTVLDSEGRPSADTMTP